MPLPKVWAPPPPTALQELLNRSLDEAARPFIRAMALDTLLHRLEIWMKDSVDYARTPKAALWG